MDASGAPMTPSVVGACESQKHQCNQAKNAAAPTHGAGRHEKETAQREQATQAHTSKDLQTLLAVVAATWPGLALAPQWSRQRVPEPHQSDTTQFDGERRSADALRVRMRWGSVWARLAPWVRVIRVRDVIP
jgi:hypothetical protein